jgi:hypothetical protein
MCHINGSGRGSNLDQLSKRTFQGLSFSFWADLESDHKDRLRGELRALCSRGQMGHLNIVQQSDF